MKLDQIRYLMAINQYHSLHQASEKLFITPQALSQSIAALEKELNLKLTESSHNGTFLTKNGHILLDAGEDFLRVITEMQNAENFVSYKNLPTAKISVPTVAGMANTLMPKIISFFYQEYPEIQLKIRAEQSCFALLESMNSHQLQTEFAFISHFQYIGGSIPNLPLYPNLKFEPLISSRYCVSVPENHEIYRYKSVSISTVLKYPILVLRDSAEITIPLLNAYGTPQKIIFIDDYAVFNQMVQSHTPYLTLNRMSSSFETSMSTNHRKNILLKENIQTNFGYICRIDSELSDVSKEFLDAVHRYCLNHFGAIED